VSWPAGSGGADPADRLAQEVAGAASARRGPTSEASHEHVAGPGRHGEQGVIAAHARIRDVRAALLRQAVRLADRRVEVDRKRLLAWTRARRPGPRQKLATDPVDLADVAPAEAAQERAEGGRRLQGEAEDPDRPTRAQRIRVVDAVAAREGRHDEAQELVTAVRPTGAGPELEVPLDEVPQAEPRGQGGRQ
jgi:hypothetical protein